MTNFNGKLFNKETSLISIYNRGLNYGDALFETMRYSAGKIIFWEDHYFRLMASMRMLRMEIPMNFTMEFLQEEVQKIVKDDENALRIKIIIYRKEGGKYNPTSREIEYLITKETLKEDHYLLDVSSYEIELYKDFAVSSGLLSGLKTTNKLINVLGSIFAEENHYQNCLLLNESKNVVEALNANVFLVFGKTIVTPPLTDGCLNGILRKKLIGILKADPDYEMVERSVSPFELQKADEIFLTNVITGIRPVTKYRKKEFITETSEKMIHKLNMLRLLG
ncbi:MAG TPA: aminotransferase class IV [Flavobacteriaceae bacterium]|nr:aminotransferase class IV [Flavobacteriaceae bacterium]